MRKVKETISWVLADSAELDPTQDIEDLKRIGPLWGSWKTWRAYQTDNVICHDQSKATELLQRNFQNSCNFYMPDSIYASLDRPGGVKVYAGEFVHDVIRQEEIVAMHLAATTSDIVIMLGWNLVKIKPDADLLRANQIQHHRNLIRQAFIDYDTTQWVIVDHADQIDANLAQCPNVVVDTLSTVLNLG
jgi:hypothetical protein